MHKIEIIYVFGGGFGDHVHLMPPLNRCMQNSYLGSLTVNMYNNNRLHNPWTKLINFDKSIHRMIFLRAINEFKKSSLITSLITYSLELIKLTILDIAILVLN